MRAVFLSGPGGAGKTTIGKATQALLGGDWLFFEGDRCHPCLPTNPAFATVENDRRVVRAMLAAAHAYVTEGFPILVELDVADEWRRSACEERFSDVPTLFVVLTAPREVAMDRVKSRGTDSRWRDWFETYYDQRPWSTLPNTFVLDTSRVTPEQAARELALRISSDPG